MIRSKRSCAHLISSFFCKDDWDEADYEAVEKADGKANESSDLS